MSHTPWTSHREGREAVQCLVVRVVDNARGECQEAEAQHAVARGECQEVEAQRAVVRGEGREAEEARCVIVCGKDIVHGEGCAAEAEVEGACVHIMDIMRGERQEAEAKHAVVQGEGQEVEEVRCVIVRGEDIMCGEGHTAEVKVGGACVCVMDIAQGERQEVEARCAIV